MNKTGTIALETPRLLIRRFRAEDAEAMYKNWASDPVVTRFLTWPAHESIEVTKRVLADWTGRYDDGAYFNWALELKSIGEVIGSIAVVQLHEPTLSATLGYCLGEAFRGQGLMPEAVKAVMDYLFDSVGMNRVSAYHDVNNPASGRVMDKCGMKLEGILRQNAINNTGICDIAVHATIRLDREENSSKAPHSN